jgi:ankyrin repeat protein
MASTGSDVKKEGKKKEEPVVESSNEQKSSSVAAAAASLTKDAIMIKHRIVSHTTNFEAVQSILNDGVQLKSNFTNRFDCQTFYVAEGGNSIHAVSGNYTLIFGMSNKAKIYDIAKNKIKGHGNSAFSAGNEFTEAVRNDGYDAIKYKNPYKGSNFAIIRNPHYLTITGVYPTPAGAQPARLAPGRSSPAVMTSRGFTQVRPTSATTSSVPLPDTAISLSTIKTIQVLGTVGTGYALYHAGRLVAASDNPYVEAQHQATLWTAASQGGMAAGRAAIPFCALVGKASPHVAWFSVPVCIAGASTVGGAIAVIGAEVTWQTIDSGLKVLAVTLPENQDKTQESNDLIPRAGFHMGQFKDDKGQIVYRGDGRGPSEIFKEGFQREITVTDVIAHIAAEEGGYISTSLSKVVAEGYPAASDMPDGASRTYIYEIHTTKPGINVAEALAKHDPNHPDIEDFLESKEIAFPENIQSREVKGCWEADVMKTRREWKHAEKFRQLGYSEEWIEQINTDYERTVNDKFIPNPNYKPEGIFAWNKARLMGHGLLAIGATLDGIHFYAEYQQSKLTGNYDNTYREIERIAGGWTGAYVMGTWLAGQTALYTVFLTPPVQTTCTFTAGLFGSALGYWGFSTAFMKLYDIRNAQSAMMVKSTKVASTKGLTCTISEMEHARIGKCVVDSNLQQAIQKSQLSADPSQLSQSSQPTDDFGSGTKSKSDTPLVSPSINSEAQHSGSSSSVDSKIHDVMSRPWPQSRKEEKLRDQLDRAGGVLGVIRDNARLEAVRSGKLDVNKDFKASDLLAPGSAAKQLHDKLQEVATRPHPRNSKEREQRERLDKAGGILGIITEGLREQHAKEKQAKEAEKKITEIKGLNHALNGTPFSVTPTVQARPLASQNAVHTVYKPPFHSDDYWNRPRSFYLPYNPIHDYYHAKSQLYSYNLSSSDRLHAEWKLEHGFSYVSNLSSFSSSLSTTGLVETYNNYHLFLVRDVFSGLGSIGGVATEISLIENLLNSEAHAKAKEYFICFPAKGFTFPLKLVLILAREIDQGFVLYKTLPFFSLHFNNDGLLYPVLHPFYQNTLVGLIISLLDYWMKGYLNGVIFQEEFLKKWSALENCDEAHLRANIIDLQQYCKNLEKERSEKFGYESLNAKESRSGALKAEEGGFVNEGMQTSFRIIAKQGHNLSLSGNIILADPEFEVKYSIELTPKAEAYLEEYHKEHGVYPEAYKQTREDYIHFAEEIKKKMPKLPFCRDFFQLLGVINSLCYAYASFEEMGLKPVVAENQDQNEVYQVPKSFPPLPIRYFKTYALELSLLGFLKSLMPEELEIFNQLFFKSFSTEDFQSLNTIDQTCEDFLRKKIHALIQIAIVPKLPATEVFECNEDELERIVARIKTNFFATQKYLKTAYVEHLLALLQPLKLEASIKGLSLPEKIAYVEKALEAHYPKFKEYFENAEDLSHAEILKNFAKSWHPEVKRVLQEEEVRVETSKAQALLFCKEAFGFCEVHEKILIEQILARPNYGYEFELISAITLGVALEEDKIYLQALDAGLKYQVIHKGELKTNTLAWNELPPDFPHKDELIAELREEGGLALYKSIEKKGDLLSVQECQRQGFQETLKRLEASVEADHSQAYTLSAGKIPANPQKGNLYLEGLPEGLSYEVLGFDGELAKDTIPWEELPPGFPQNAQQVAQLTLYDVTYQMNQNYVALFNWTQKKGHAGITNFHFLHAQQARLLSLKPLLEGNFNSLRAAVTQLSSAPPPGYAFSPEALANLPNMREELPKLEETVSKLNAELIDCQTEIANLPKEKENALITRKKEVYQNLSKHIEENTLQASKKVRKRKALFLLEFVQKANIQQIQQHAKEIEHFSDYIFARPKQASRVLSKDYTHSFLTFTGQGLDEKIGKPFKIVGGCGMSLPTLHAKPLEHAQAFSQSLATVLLETQEDLVNFSFNEQNYLALRMSVEEVNRLDLEEEVKPQNLKAKEMSKAPDLELEVAEISKVEIDEITPQRPLFASKTKAQDAFLNLAFGDEDPKKLPLPLLQESLDLGKAGFIHYSAAFLKVETFKEIGTRLGEEAFNAQDALGNTALHFAALEGNRDTAALILSSSFLEKNPKLVDIQNQQGLTPLAYAVQKGHFEMVKLLISFKADPNHKLPNGIFPLYMALQAKEAVIALWLINEVPNLNMSESLDSKMTALHLAMEMGLIEVAKQLIEKKASCDIKRKSDGFSPLDLAIAKGFIELVKLMQAHGVSLYVIGEYNRTRLHLAAEYGQILCVEFLISQDLDVSAQDSEGDSPLMRAIKSGQFETAKILAAKAPINQCNKKGETASLLALLYGMPHIGDLLLERGESPNHRDAKGYNYVYYLLRNGEYQRLGILIEEKIIDYSQSFILDSHQARKVRNLLELAAEFLQFPIVYQLMDSTALKMPEIDLLKCAIAADEAAYLRRKAKPFLKGNYREFSLIAAQKGAFHCLHWLLKAQPMAKPEEYQLWFKATIEESNSLETLELLIHHCEINAPLDSQGNRALHLATRQGFIQGVDLLLSSGALSSRRNNSQQTPFHIALIQKNHSLLKRLFKRSSSEEWPRDLWQTPVNQPTRLLVRTLEFYRRRLKEEVVFNLTSPLEEKKALPTLLLDEEMALGLTALCFKLNHGQFKEACELLNEKPELFSLFDSEQGSELLKLAFSALRDPALQKLDEVCEDDGVDDFFRLLKNKGVNPLLYKGKHNLLWTLLESELAEEDLGYRLRLLRKYFPERLAFLAVDKAHSECRFIELALHLNKIALFKALAEVSAQTSKQGKIPFYPLHEAVKADQYDLVIDLLKTYDVNEANDQGQTPLMFAAEKNNISLINLLLSRGANPDKVDLQGRNVLYYALNAKNKSQAAALHLIPLLREKNQASHNGETPLMWAAANGALAALSFCSEQGDYIESYDKQGWNALHHAASKGQASCIEFLIAQGFNSDAREKPVSPKKEKQCLQRTPLHLAALNAQLEAVKKLIKLGASVSLEDRQNQGFFEYGLRSKNSEMLEFMQTEELYPLYLARGKQALLNAVTTNHEEALCELILRGVPLNVSDSSGSSLLHLAAMHNAGKVLGLLLRGRDLALDVVDLDGMTPLQYASFLGYVLPVKLLCQARANINYHSSKVPTPLFLACEQGQKGAVAVLLEHGADYSLTNFAELTPAQVALLKGHMAIVASLKLAGDQSVTLEAFEKLPEETREKLKAGFLAFSASEEAKPPLRMAGALIRHGIYRQISKPQIATSETLPNNVVMKVS